MRHQQRGETAGVAGIKVALPLYIVEREMCFLELYLEHIASMQRMHGQGRVLPVAIMTSDDTHDLTIRLLHEKKVWELAELAGGTSCAVLDAGPCCPFLPAPVRNRSGASRRWRLLSSRAALSRRAWR